MLHTTARWIFTNATLARGTMPARSQRNAAFSFNRHIAALTHETPSRAEDESTGEALRRPAFLGA